MTPPDAPMTPEPTAAPCQCGHEHTQSGECAERTPGLGSGCDCRRSAPLPPVEDVLKRVDISNLFVDSRPLAAATVPREETPLDQLRNQAMAERSGPAMRAYLEIVENECIRLRGLAALVAAGSDPAPYVPTYLTASAPPSPAAPELGALRVMVEELHDAVASCATSPALDWSNRRDRMVAARTALFTALATLTARAEANARGVQSDDS